MPDKLKQVVVPLVRGMICVMRSTPRIREELGWQPSVTLEEGLRATVEWYLAREDWWQPLLDREGVGERLGTG